MGETVNDALGLHAQRDDEGALAILLKRWSEAPHPELAAVIETMCAQPGRERLSGGTRAKRRREWIEIEEEESPQDAARLIDAFRDLSCAQATELIEYVAQWPPSPVTSSRLVALVREPPAGFSGQGKVGFWEALLEVLRAIADPRQAGPLRECAQSDRLEDALEEYLPPRLYALADELDAVSPELPANELAAVRELAERVSGGRAGEELARRAEALLREVYANPTDDAVRLVLADVLTELGDPRGEFIIIQFNRESGTATQAMKSRERALLTGYRRDWLGGIERAVGKSGLKYQRGFPAVGRIELEKLNDAERTEVLARPEWTTFVELESYGRGDALLRRADMKSLKRVISAPPSILEATQALAIEELHISGMPTPEQLQSVGRVCPRLRVLKLPSCGPDLGRHMWQQGWRGPRLEVLQLHEHGVAWLREIQRDPPVDAFEIGAWAWDVAVRRGDTDELDRVELTCTSHYYERTVAESLLIDCGSQDFSFVRDLTVVYSTLGEVEEAARQEVLEALRRLNAPAPKIVEAPRGSP